MPTASQQIRFCTSSDGVRLAYAVTGHGPPIVKAANWPTHLEVDWNSPVWRHWLAELSRNRTLVRYDERGWALRLGRSGPVARSVGRRPRSGR